MTYTFETIPLKTDSRILYRNQCKLEKYDVRYEFWRVHGLLVECISFGNDDVSDLDDEELEQLDFSEQSLSKIKETCSEDRMQEI